MNARDIARLRLHRQGIAAPAFETPAKVVGWLGAVQAQEHAVSRWSIGQRARGVTAAAVIQAVTEGRIIRTHALRPTWHYLAAKDARWILALTAPRVKKLLAYYDRRLEIDAATLRRSHAILARTLAGGRRLVRNELAEALAAKGVAATGQRLGHLIMHAELDAVICSGGLRGVHHAYALFDEMAPSSRMLSPDEALAELTLRYFRSHGPATVKDYMAWSSARAAEARRGIEMCGSDLQSFELDALKYWHADGLDAPKLAAPRADLLQGYDEYIMGYTESRRAIDLAGIGGGAEPVGGLRYDHALLIDGQVAGRWRRATTARAQTLQVRLTRKLKRREMAALETEAERYGAFTGLPVTLQVMAADV